MSSAGPFILISNDGKQDKLIMATQLLNSRIQNIVAKKQEKRRLPMNHPESLPSLMDIEQTHILYTLAYYKPFAAIAFCYSSTSPEGSVSLNSDVQFQIPQFGDFFNDMAVKITLKQPTVTYHNSTTPNLKPLGRWCDYPGERLLKNVKFSVNGQVLDQYNSSDTVFHRNQFVNPGKMAAWNRCMGQEATKTAFSQRSDAGWDPSVSGDVNHFNFRLSSNLRDGYQTPKAPNSSEELSLMIPLLFWFNNSPRLSMPSAAIPNGMRNITISLASIHEMYGLVPRVDSSDGRTAVTDANVSAPANFVVNCQLIINNLFVLPEIHNIYIKRVTFTLIRVHLSHREELNKSNNSILLSQLKYPVEYMSIGVRPKDYEKTEKNEAYKYLSKWHLFNKSDEADIDTGYAKFVKRSLGSVSWDESVDPNEIKLADDLVVDVPAGSIIVIDGEPVRNVLVAADVGDDAVDITPAFGSLETGTADAVVYIPVAETFTKQNVTLPVDTLGLKSHGVTIYDEQTINFYNSYLPSHYGGEVLNSSEDAGIMFMPFCLYPGAYQPSGHINMSRARECNLELKGSWLSSSNVGQLYVNVSAINFLLVADGSCVLRFNT